MKTHLENAISKDTEFLDIVKELINNKTVQEMKDYKQHYETSCYEHCYIAAYYCYLICKKFNLDYKSAARGAMLHDLFLYDWRKPSPYKEGMHAFSHGRIACRNAEKLFDLNKIEKDMIIKHMWPVTISMPKYAEGFVLTFVDKYCALSESFDVFKLKLYNVKPIKYIHNFFSTAK